MAKIGSNTEKKSEKKPRGKGKPFQKRDATTGKIDPRINIKGRPKSFDEFRKLAQALATETIKISGPDGKEIEISQAEFILRRWMLGEFPGQKYFSEVAYGKPPEPLPVDPEGKPVPPTVIVYVPGNNRKQKDEN